MYNITQLSFFSQKLRRVMRKAFLLSENVFDRPKGLVKELSNYVVENLGTVYPELEKNIGQVSFTFFKN